eukprot:768796-Hanusia_phi.AAC.4
MARARAPGHRTRGLPADPALSDRPPQLRVSDYSWQTPGNLVRTGPGNGPGPPPSRVPFEPDGRAEPALPESEPYPGRDKLFKLPVDNLFIFLLAYLVYYAKNPLLFSPRPLTLLPPTPHYPIQVNTRVTLLPPSLYLTLFPEDDWGFEVSYLDPFSDSMPSRHALTEFLGVCSQSNTSIDFS